GPSPRSRGRAGGIVGRADERRSRGVGTPRGSPAIIVVEVEADLAAVELEPGLEAVAGFRLETAEQGGPPLSEQGLGRAGADGLAGDGLPDREPTALPPAAATERLLLLDD